jgi:RNA polymerase sigma factor (sigma-70 family)
MFRTPQSMLEDPGIPLIWGQEKQVAGSTLKDKDDRELFDEVFLPNLTEAYRLARWLTGNTSDAEDVVQDAALRAFRGIKNFGSINARAWSLTIVRNTAYSWLQKNRPKALLSMEDLSEPDKHQFELEHENTKRTETPEDIVLQKAEIENINQALARLPALFREVIVLREMHELNYRDIAEIANIPIGTVMSRLSRARQMLIEYMKDDGL